MSQLQTLVKPYLLPLIQGDAFAIDEKGQAIVAAWIAMTISVAEHFSQSDDRIAVSSADRRHIRKTLTAPPNWGIWIAHLERGNWKPYLVHNVFFISSAKHRIKRNKLGRQMPNTQTTAFTINELYIFAASSPVGIFDDWRFPRTIGAGKLKTLWPVKRNILSWPGTSLSGEEADSIAGSFFRFAEAVGRTVSAPPIP
jgi:hypothetical protein